MRGKRGTHLKRMDGLEIENERNGGCWRNGRNGEIQKTRGDGTGEREKLNLINKRKMGLGGWEEAVINPPKGGK